MKKNHTITAEVTTKDEKKLWQNWQIKLTRNGDEITSSTMHHSFRPPLPNLKSRLKSQKS